MYISKTIIEYIKYIFLFSKMYLFNVYVLNIIEDTLQWDGSSSIENGFAFESLTDESLSNHQ